MLSNWDGAWLEFYYHWGLMSSQPGGRGVCLLPRPQGIIELALPYALLAHIVLPLEAHATSTHLGEILRERANKSECPSGRWASPQGRKSLVLLVWRASLFPAGVLGTQECRGIRESLGAPHLTFSGLAKRFNHVFSPYPSYSGSLFGQRCHRFYY